MTQTRFISFAKGQIYISELGIRQSGIKEEQLFHQIIRFPQGWRGNFHHGILKGAIMMMQLQLKSEKLSKAADN